MLISHRKRFIYTKTVKTAGTSIESYFEKFCMPEGSWLQQHHRETYISDTGIIGYRGQKGSQKNLWYNHMSAARIKKQVSDEVWNDYFKFCVIRDPFDKAVSTFYHVKRGQESRNLQLQKPSLKNRLSNFLFPTPEFSHISQEFEHWLIHKVMPVDRDKYIIDSNFCLDGVIRYENLIRDTEKICNRLDIEFDPSLLPNLKIGKRDASVTLSEIYTPK
ncbi:MAG: sulfotransferase family 2 domain-containing protein, partial [Akkermansiaceae bacterium]